MLDVSIALRAFEILADASIQTRRILSRIGSLRFALLAAAVSAVVVVLVGEWHHCRAAGSYQLLYCRVDWRLERFHYLIVVIY